MFVSLIGAEFIGKLKVCFMSAKGGHEYYEKINLINTWLYENFNQVRATKFGSEKNAKRGWAVNWTPMWVYTAQKKAKSN